MDKNINLIYSQRANLIKALAHPTRLFIVDFLEKKERCVCEIVEQVGVDVSTISKHLAVMKKVGLVNSEKRGLNVYYKLSCPCILNLFTCIESISNKE